VKGVLAAEYGGSIGGQVNMITRSGTNQFHGSLLENFENEAFWSRDPFLPATTPKPDIKFNQFGGSLGGPIVRNRVLFFTKYEGYREESGRTEQGSVPTQRRATGRIRQQRARTRAAQRDRGYQHRHPDTSPDYSTRHMWLASRERRSEFSRSL
jgi:hypothetical protein